ADSEQRASFRADGATSGYDRNFFIASPDGNYRLNIEGQIQSRYSFNFMPTPGLSAGPVVPGGKQNEYGFELRRVRLNFFGNIIDPSWTYRVQIAFERDGTIQNRPLTLEDAFLQKALGGGWFFRMGQWKNFFNYEEINSSRTQQLVERSMLNQYFTTQFIQGALLGWESEHVRTFLSYNDGGGNRNIAVIQKNGNPTDWAFTARADWLLAGAWGQIRDMQGWVGSPFAAMAGVAVNAQRASGVVTDNRLTVGNGAIPGMDGLAVTVAPLNLTSWTADINLRGSGWSGWAAFLGNYMSSSDPDAIARGVGSAVSLGAVVQGGIFAFWLLLTAHWLACAWSSITPTYEGDAATRYLASYYWVVETLATVGYGETT
ncbi:MAG: porin, partial [Phycisphaerales bacterium]